MIEGEQEWVTDPTAPTIRLNCKKAPAGGGVLRADLLATSSFGAVAVWGWSGQAPWGEGPRKKQ